MRVKDRQNYIIDCANMRGYVSKADIAEALGISKETVRRDIAQLCEKKLLQRAKGGAEPIKNIVRRDVAYTSRVHQFRDERVSIGSAAASFIQDNDIIGLDSGVSIQAIAEAASGVKNVTFVTNSLPTALILYGKIEMGAISGRVIVIGGEMNNDRCASGAMACEMVNKFHYDTAFISCSALSEDTVSAYNLDLCIISEDMLKNANQAILIAESDKLGKNSLYGFASLADFNKIIVDDKFSMPDEMKHIIDKANIELIVTKRRK